MQGARQPSKQSRSKGLSPQARSLCQESGGALRTSRERAPTVPKYQPETTASRRQSPSAMPAAHQPKPANAVAQYLSVQYMGSVSMLHPAACLVNSTNEKRICNSRHYFL